MRGGLRSTKKAATSPAPAVAAEPAPCRRPSVEEVKAEDEAIADAQTAEVEAEAAEAEAQDEGDEADTAK